MDVSFVSTTTLHFPREREGMYIVLNKHTNAFFTTDLNLYHHRSKGKIIGLVVYGIPVRYPSKMMTRMQYILTTSQTRDRYVR